MDKYKQRQDEAAEEVAGLVKSNKPFIEYSAIEIYRELIEEKKGATA